MADESHVQLRMSVLILIFIVGTMKILIAILILIHGLIHVMGFAKAFSIGNLTQFTKEISRPMGLLWLLTGLLFIAMAILNLMKKDTWPILAIIAVVLSQTLIFTVWSEAKYGTIINIIVLIVAIVGLATKNFENSYRRDVTFAMEKINFRSVNITENDLTRLPEPVKKYLEYVGVVGKPKIQNVRIVFDGEMRDRGKDWFAFTSEQYNFFLDPTRLFFL